MNCFITGTDTGVGKTHCTALLLRTLTKSGMTAAGYKPVCSGGREDAAALLAASSAPLELDEVNPFWFRVPLSPLVAALIENRPVPWEALLTGYHALAKRFDRVLVEGAGGWETPLSQGKTMADFAAALQLPVIVVAANRLGALNHTILTVRSVQARGLRCAGIILNHVEEERDAASISNRAVLEELLQVAVLAEVMHNETELALEQAL
ncbi:MAG: dethiobiotin synthase [Verrucomicrobiales bacterium]|nr:dethiobiotin synthase [Verrucomicrobiales bacterium]